MSQVDCVFASCFCLQCACYWAGWLKLLSWHHGDISVRTLLPSIVSPTVEVRVTFTSPPPTPCSPLLPLFFFPSFNLCFSETSASFSFFLYFLITHLSYAIFFTSHRFSIPSPKMTTSKLYTSSLSSLHTPKAEEIKDKQTWTDSDPDETCRETQIFFCCKCLFRRWWAVMEWPHEAHTREHINSLTLVTYFPFSKVG